MTEVGSKSRIVNSYHQNFFQIAIDKDLFLKLFNICKILFGNRNLF